MKKQIQVLATTFITVAFISCNKEKIETSPANPPMEEAMARNPEAPGLVINTINYGLLGRYEFDGNLKDTTGNLEDGDLTSDRVIYTTDRKGQAKKAIRFNGAYGVDIFEVPLTPESASISFWIKDDVIESPYWIKILGSSEAFNFIQNQLEFNCSFWNGTNIIQQVGTAPVNSQWHHIAATRDKTSLKLYIDGVLIGTAPSPAGGVSASPTHNYFLGYGAGAYWKGSMDDLRFYKRTLTALEVVKLKNL